MEYTMVETPVRGLPGEVLLSAVNADGHYIGDESTAQFLCNERGIVPQLARPGHGVCSIGFCEAEQKWYGWSHRAICGFGIGSTISRGDCGYVPVDWDDFLTQAAAFWDGPESGHAHVTATRGVDDEGRECAHVAWEYTDDIPNKELRGKISGSTMYPPDKWGRGEWTAQSLDDAKQMATDFAESVG